MDINEPVAYINVEERKLEWAKPTTWHTPTVAKMDKIPLYNNDKRFDLDLQYGQVFEKKVADMLQHSKIEVKTEREKWKSTGNIVIEFESRGKPSGIATTEAEYWFHNLALGNDIVMTLVIPTKILRNYIAQTMPRIVSGGDNNTSRLYLLNLQSLVKMINVCA
jgi:hypothetical protein